MVKNPNAPSMNSDEMCAAARDRAVPFFMRQGAPELWRRRTGAGNLVTVVFLGLASLFVSGCGHEDEHDGHTSDAPFDQQFIDMMTPHHEGAVMMAQTAQTRAEHAELKTMADDIISAQNQEIAELKAWRKQWYGSDQTPPVSEMPMLPGMAHDSTMDMVQMNEDLKTANPFDKAFIDAMIPHHEMAIEAAEIAQQKAEHAEIKQMADAIVGAQQTEIDQMKAWRTEWYPGQ